MDRIDQAIERVIAKWPENMAVVEGDLRWTYAQLAREIALQQERLRESGLEPGERVILWLKNSSHYISSYLAILGLGGVVVAVHPDAMISEVLRTIAHVGGSGIVTTSAKWKKNAKAFERSGVRFVMLPESGVHFHGGEKQGRVPEGLAQILYTSGTTGNPKGIMLSHENLIANAESVLKCLSLTPSDAMVAVLPFVFSYGNSVMMTHLLSGAKIIIEEYPLYAHCVVESMKKESATGFSGVASNYAFLLRESCFRSEALPSLRYFTSAGGPMPLPLLTRVREAFPAADFHVMYGQTEATARIAMLAPEQLERKRGSAGHAVPGVSLKIVDDDGSEVLTGTVGEIIVTGPNRMMGCWQDEEATAGKIRGGWLYTGDLGFVDEEGFLFITGRKSEMIKTGGMRVSPEEIEEVLLDQEDVLEAGVAGVPDEAMGEVIVAGVVSKPDREFRVHELMGHCAKRLAPFKRPIRILPLSRIPRSANQKILRRQLEEQLRLLHQASKPKTLETETSTVSFE